MLYNCLICLNGVVDMWKNINKNIKKYNKLSKFG